MDRNSILPGPGHRPGHRIAASDHGTSRLDLGWICEELNNLLFLAERAGMQATARDLRFAIRSAEVELRQAEGVRDPDESELVSFLRDAPRPAP